MSLPIVTKNDKFIAISDFEIHCLKHWAVPCTGSFKCKTQKGTVFIALNDTWPKTHGFYTLPENSEEFKLKYAPENDQNAPEYGGYSFVFYFKDIGKKIGKVN